MKRSSGFLFYKHRPMWAGYFLYAFHKYSNRLLYSCAGGEINRHVLRYSYMLRGQLRPNANPNDERNRNDKNPLSDNHATPNKRPLK